MKKVLLSLLVAVFALASTNVMAQETKSEKLRWKGHETNKFWDNWEISAGFGNSYLDVNTKVKGNGDPGKFFDRNSWNANFAVTKWFVPIVGMRLQLDGGQFQNYSNNPGVVRVVLELTTIELQTHTDDRHEPLSYSEVSVPAVTIEELTGVAIALNLGINIEIRVTEAGRNLPVIPELVCLVTLPTELLALSLLSHHIRRSQCKYGY